VHRDGADRLAVQGLSDRSVAREDEVDVLGLEVEIERRSGSCGDGFIARRPGATEAVEAGLDVARQGVG